MSKPVRLPDYLHAEIERLAAEEKRSLANMVQVLLEQALHREQWAAEQRKTPSVEPEGSLSERDGETPSRVTGDTKLSRAESDSHFKPDFK